MNKHRETKIEALGGRKLPPRPLNLPQVYCPYLLKNRNGESHLIPPILRYASLRIFGRPAGDPLAFVDGLGLWFSSYFVTKIQLAAAASHT